MLTAGTSRRKPASRLGRRRPPGEPAGAQPAPVVRSSVTASRTPDSIETVFGWRTWLAVADGDTVRLASPLYGTIWPVGRETDAACTQPALPAHVAPDGRCNCGIYAGSRVGTALAAPHAPAAFEACSILQPVLGRVALWGKVVECDSGWRAEHAYPARIYVPVDPGAGSRAARLRAERTAERVALGLKAYGVPVHVLAGGAADLEVGELESERRMSGGGR